MKNIVTATIEFYFKGKKFSPTLTIELDKLIQSSHSFPNLYPLIATSNNIDHYSYEYEMMCSETIKYTSASGLVAEFITDRILDEKRFVSAWKEDIITVQLKLIAEETMGIKNLDEHLELERALIKAYRAGQAHSPEKI
jgi:hypothetical protein